MKIFNLKLKVENKKGFIILFAVTLSAILLAVALGVASISFKEVGFSTSARDSNDAFLAGDAGSECALYYDKLASSSFPIAGPATQITCGTTTVTPTFTGTTNTGSYDFVLTGLGSAGQSCAKVNVFKDKTTVPTKVVISSNGYNMGDATCNSTNSHRVGRELVVSSYVGATPAYTPAPSTVDIKCNAADSCSIGYNTSALLSWTTSSSITSCTATAGPWSGSKSWPSGSESTGALTSTQTYTITCSGVSGSTQDSVTVTVASAPTPTVVTNSASAVTGSSATLNGSGNPNGYASTGWFRYSTTNPGTCNDTFGTRSPASSGTALGSGSSPVAYSSNISGLSVSTTYYFCAIASNANGTAFGAVSSFTTSATCTITGGTTADIGGYRIHTFTTASSPATLSVGCSKNVDYLVVGGGGGGGSQTFSDSQGGGGGAGGMLSGNTTLVSGSYTITVGSGGGANISGTNSSISGVATASGGGAGGSGDSDNGNSGGSGGGGGGKRGNLPGNAFGGSGTAGQGNNGGGGDTCDTTDTAGGGGGAGGIGGGAQCDGNGGSGGAGVLSSISGSSAFYAHGGAAPGGTGNSGVQNTGDGGNHDASGKNGIVIIRYIYP